MIDEPNEIGDFDTVLTRWIDGSPVCRSVDNFDIRKFKGVKPVYLTSTRKVYPDPDQNWDDLENIVLQSWQDYYDTPMPEEERQSLLEALGKSSPKESQYIPPRDKTYVTPSKIYSPKLIPGYRVYDKTGNYLFALGDHRDSNARDITAIDVYNNGVQWFAPTADNYMPIDSINPDIQKNERILHVNPKDLYKFANGRHPLGYRAEGPGDWKKQVAKGYFLAEMNGYPYWSDALGQIPFTLDTYRAFKKDPIYKYFPITATKISGRIFGDGCSKPDFSNSSDNYLIDETVNWYDRQLQKYNEKKDSTNFYLNGLLKNEIKK